MSKKMLLASGMAAVALASMVTTAAATPALGAPPATALLCNSHDEPDSNGNMWLVFTNCQQSLYMTVTWNSISAHEWKTHCVAPGHTDLIAPRSDIESSSEDFGCF
ncbi:hypothetical protein GCM10010174_47980 [Kutzneria viridogrisea]|uniref:Secreted protein n=2 Tax=Kutzneria TaxID=43356 RepID=W5WE96_9PSEU|nr:hypothetical protein [Kutzneria albida]AHH98921.1 hypothetical protein KALB_5559 [Kutzneria albida DSM 43870]MBA8923524.1 hypothetical protein [Kutzneria viridogrisea]